MKKKNNSKYLVRPHDFRVFELDFNNAYRAYEEPGKEIVNRSNAQSHFTFKNLTQNYDFFVIQESEIQDYQKKNHLYYKYQDLKWKNDHHGGVYENTNIESFEEFIKNNFNKSDNKIITKKTKSKLSSYSRLQIKDQITLLEKFIEHPTKPGYKRRDIVAYIAELSKKLID